MTTKTNDMGPPENMTFLAHWVHAWSALGIKSSSTLQALHQQLIERYSEPHRHYHNLQHLAECFEHLTKLKPETPHPAEVEIALWFHDAIYDTHKNDNESRSAAWATEAALSFGVNQTSADLISKLVMATRHAVEPEGLDAEALVDIDLAILGSKLERFAEYENQIRKEYAWVPEPLFRSKRIPILKQFLARRYIYSTFQFREGFERKARENIKKSLEVLERGM